MNVDNQLGSTLACFVGGTDTIERLRARFHLGKTEGEINRIIDRLIASSFGSYSTRLYDSYQWLTNGIV